MDISIILAKIFGFMIFMTSLASLLRQDVVMNFWRRLIRDEGSTFFIGLVLLFLGSVTLALHWRLYGPEFLVTLIGISMVLKGASLLFFEKSVIRDVVKVFSHHELFRIVHIAGLFIGLFLLLIGLL